MRFLSVCSGIEAASVAWHPIGWKALAFSEIEAFPRAVLAHHYPDVPLHGDFTVLRDQPWIADADVLVGGTPCQAFSVAGLRQSLSDDRGNLTLEYVRLADAVDDLRRARGEQPAIVVWENVPGVLSVKDNAFGCFLAALVGNDAPIVHTGKRWTNAGLVIGPKRAAAWRVLDAQYFGVAQRRRRVFVVASAREGFDPAAVLFEREGVPRNTPPSRSTGQEVAGTLEASLGRSRGAGTPTSALSHWDGDQFPHPTLNQSSNIGGVGQSNQELFSQRGAYLAPVAFHPTQDPITSEDGTTHALGCGSKQGQASVAVAFHSNQSFDSGNNVEVAPTLQIGSSGTGQPPAVAFPLDLRNAGRDPDKRDQQNRQGVGVGNENDPSSTLSTAHVPGVATSMAVRRLTPRECERLQGFPDDYTLIPVRNKPAADGPRYKALGNSMAVPVMHWIGKRIQKHLEAIQ